MLAEISVEGAQGAVLIIGAIAAPVLAAITLIISYLTNRQNKRVENEVKIIKKYTNNALGESLRTAMISAYLLAAQQPTEEYRKLAREAEDKYIRHGKQMDAGLVEASQQDVK